MVNSRLKVLAAMSGGVDSSVAAYLMQQRGYQVTGIIMQIWGGEAATGGNAHHGCYGPEEEADIEDARRVAGQLGIALKVIDLTQEYQTQVLDYFCQEYLTGRTPNPCVRCNQRVKFGALIDKAIESGLDFNFVASGHYAKTEFDAGSGRYLLKKATDLSKDQSYFLSFLTQSQLKRLQLPLGDLPKSEVREIAAGLGMVTAAKPDSQNFVSGGYTSVIKSEAKPGNIIDKNGQVMGRHSGLQHYTIGQRKGLGIAAPQSLYVTELNALQNTVVVGTREDIYKSDCLVSQLNWIAIEKLDAPLSLKVKLRSSHPEAEAEIVPLENGQVRLHFKEPQMAVTPGQAAVFYQKDIVVGAGIIENKTPNN